MGTVLHLETNSTSEEAAQTNGRDLSFVDHRDRNADMPEAIRRDCFLAVMKSAVESLDTESLPPHVASTDRFRGTEIIIAVSNGLQTSPSHLLRAGISRPRILKLSISMQQGHMSDARAR